MEAATVPAAPAVRGERLRNFIGTYGLITVLLLAIALLVILVICMFGSGILNTMIERVGYRPLRSAPKLAPLITAVGFSFILQNVGLLWRGGSQEGITDLINSQHRLFDIVGVGISNGDLLSIF